MEKRFEMFSEMLSKGTVEQAVTSVYYAVRIIRHIKHIGSIEDGHVVKDLITEPSSDEVVRAKEILSLIEDVEQSPLEKLEQTKAEEYIQLLADVLLKLVQSKFQYDLNRGKDLLYDCRKDFYWKLK